MALSQSQHCWPSLWAHSLVLSCLISKASLKLVLAWVLASVLRVLISKVIYLAIFWDGLLIAELLGGFQSLLQRHLDTPRWVSQRSSTCQLRSSAVWCLLPAQNFLGVFWGIPCVGWLLFLEVGLTPPSQWQTPRNSSCHSLDLGLWHVWHLQASIPIIPHLWDLLGRVNLLVSYILCR